MKALESIRYSINIGEMTNKELFNECMKELYPNSKPSSKSGCLIHELLERVKPVEKDSIDAIVYDVCEERTLDERLIRSKKQNAELVDARVEIARRAKKKDFGTTEIGRSMNRDHSTIIYYLKNYRR